MHEHWTSKYMSDGVAPINAAPEGAKGDRVLEACSLAPCIAKRANKVSVAGARSAPCRWPRGVGEPGGSGRRRAERVAHDSIFEPSVVAAKSQATNAFSAGPSGSAPCWPASWTIWAISASLSVGHDPRQPLSKAAPQARGTTTHDQAKKGTPEAPKHRCAARGMPQGQLLEPNAKYPKEVLSTTMPQPINVSQGGVPEDNVLHRARQQSTT